MADRKRRILVIDDDTTVGTLLQPYLQSHGYDSGIVTTGAAGLNEALTAPPSLVLLGAGLPDMTGLDVFKQLRSRARTSHIPVMILAEHTEAKQQNELLAAGADDFIAKPFDMDILALRIRNMLQRTERDGVNHPRSGLPTGRLIQEHVRNLADEYGWYKLDFGIDNFDAFRNQYGFMTGEEVILFTANLLSEVVNEKGTPDDFIGHKDDNEFVIITKLAKGADLRIRLESRFNEEVLSFYNFMEREQGYIEVTADDGQVTRRDLMKARIKVVEGEPDEE